ncbi:hypothetical protein [Tunturiibacter psychrotolerans]|uniref:hypothetical protein n=1 Tax=Tunturiibacter psychrotolerans TaxID=3069686 RepID=UPI003D232378
MSGLYSEQKANTWKSDRRIANARLAGMQDPTNGEQQSGYELPDDELDRQIEKFLQWIKTDPARVSQWIQALASVALIGVTLGQLIVSCSGSNQTDKLITAADRNAAAAERFSTSADGIQSGVKDAVAKLNLQAKQLSKGADQTARLAKATEGANSTALESDRPWVGGSVTVSGFEVGSAAVISALFINAGKRSARITSIGIREFPAPSFPADPDTQFAKSGPVGSKSILIPGQVFSTNQTLPSPLTQTDLDLLKGGKMIYFIIAKAEYEDAQTKEKYWTHLCFEYYPEIKSSTNPGFGNCPEYNEAK